MYLFLFTIQILRSKLSQKMLTHKYFGKKVTIYFKITPNALQSNTITFVHMTLCLKNTQRLFSCTILFITRCKTFSKLIMLLNFGKKTINYFYYPQTYFYNLTLHNFGFKEVNLPLLFFMPKCLADSNN